MTVSIKDRVKQSTTTTGTGTITLSSTPSGYQSFSSVFSNGDTVYYVIENGSMYEIGVGTYSAGTLSRDTVLKSSSGTSLITLSGRSTVFVAIPADKSIYINDTNKASIGLGNLSNVLLTSPASGNFITYNGTNWVNANISGYTDEQAQDAVAGMLIGSTGINVSYNDGSNTLTIAATGLLTRSNNLSDLTNVSTARTNLGLGSAALSNSGDFYLSTNPSGYISAASVAAGYQPLDGDLTSIAAATGVNTIYYRSASNTWSPVVIGSGISFSTGILSNTLDLSPYATTASVASTYVPLTRTITINGSAQDLTSNRSWTVGDLRSDSTYSNPTWLTSLAWSKISGTPTTLAGYGITDGITLAAVAAGYQPLDSDLTSIAALTTTSYGRSLLTQADAPTARTTLGLGTLATQNGTFSGTSSGTNTGDQTITLTGDVTGSGTGSFAATISAGAVTLAKQANVATGTVFYRKTAGTGAPEVQTLATLKTDLGLTGTNSGDQTITLTGDVTGTGTGSFATTISAGAVTNSMLAGSIAISKLAITGTPDGTKFLRDDGTWAAASGGSGITSLGGQTGSTQTFQTATTGTDFTISSSANVHTFAIPDASASARGLVTTGAQTFIGQKTFAQGTLTSSAPFTLTQTWNSSGTAFNGLLVNCTNTASLGPSFGTIGSTVADFQVGGSSVFRVRRDGAILGGSGTFPPVMVQSLPRSNSGWNFGIAQNGEARVSIASDGVSLSSVGMFGWTSSSSDSGTTLDLTLFRDAANTLAQRNSTNAQTFNIANTWTSTTSFEYGRFQWNTNQFRIGTAVGSAGGTQRSTVLGTWDAAGAFSSFLSIDNTGAMVHGGATFFGPPSGWTIAADNASGDANLTIRAGRSGNGTGTQTISLVVNSTTVFAANIFGTSINALGNNGLALQTSGSARATLSSGQGNLTLTPSAATSGSQTGFTFTAPAPTGQTASTEATMFNVNLASTVTFAAGALPTQRAFRIQAPTYAFASASTITNAATLAIGGSPIAGTNATITNAYALWVQSGISEFDGLIRGIASASGQESLIIPHGSAPSSPTDGSIWTTTGGVFARLNGVTHKIGGETRAITCVIDGGSSAPSVGQKAIVHIPYDCTITEMRILADQTGSAVVDVWKDTYANYPPTVDDTITASAKPTLSSAIKNQDTTLTGWTTTVSAGDILVFNVDSASTLTKIYLTLTVRMT